MTKLKVLDVGCGEMFKGDVNVDLFVEPTQHRTNTKIALIAKKIPNFVNCDGQHLPFRDNTFKIVYCFHAIEHVENPFLMLKELVRVSNGRVIVKCPHRYGKNARGKTHVSMFSRTWFVKALTKIREKTFLYFRTSCFKHRQFPLFFFPEEITVEIVKIGE